MCDCCFLVFLPRVLFASHYGVSGMSILGNWFFFSFSFLVSSEVSTEPHFSFVGWLGCLSFALFYDSGLHQASKTIVLL
ncbi:hypothetical protein QBC43DRAFT_319384 [Cladorrhinum sp. PSN259]|nr:hypothetical protein QBC43DRAFT_319384 [Cladorrhinum sp. PSN259]